MLIALVGLTAAMCSAVSAAPAAWPLAGSTPAWPLQHVKNLQSSATVTYTTTNPGSKIRMTETGTNTLDYEFTSGGASCDLRQKSGVTLHGTTGPYTFTSDVGALAVADPATHNITNTAFYHMTQKGTRPRRSCTVQSQPMPPSKCNNVFTELGKQYAYAGEAACPTAAAAAASGGARSAAAAACDVWTFAPPAPRPGVHVLFSWFFAKGTARGAAFTTRSVNNATGAETSSVAVYDRWIANVAVFPAGTWNVPTSWEPCAPQVGPAEGAAPGAAPGAVGALGRLLAPPWEAHHARTTEDFRPALVPPSSRK